MKREEDLTPSHWNHRKHGCLLPGGDERAILSPTRAEKQANKMIDVGSLYANGRPRCLKSSLHRKESDKRLSPYFPHPYSNIRARQAGMKKSLEKDKRESG